MNFGQRIMLLFSLFFFFCMLLFAIGDFGGKKTAATLTGIEPSVLHYPDELTTAQNTVPCYTGNNYDQLIKHRTTTAQYTLTAQGSLADGDTMEIYTRPNGDYFVIVKGPDKSGAMEGCEVTQGWSFNTIVPAAGEESAEGMNSEENTHENTDENTDNPDGRWPAATLEEPTTPSPEEIAPVTEDSPSPAEGTTDSGSEDPQ